VKKQKKRREKNVKKEMNEISGPFCFAVFFLCVA